VFARIASFEGVDVDEAARTMDEVRGRVEPIMRNMEGFQGYMELVDRSAGKALTIALFDSAENMEAAESTFDEEMPRQLADLFSQWAGRRAGVDRYEVLVDGR